MLVSRNLLKKESGCTQRPPVVHPGRAHRRRLLIAALRKLDDSPMPNSNMRGSCVEGLWAIMFSGHSSKERSAHPQEIPVLVDTPIKDAAYPDSDSETSSTMTRVSTRSCTDCESNA
ncbi:unnamed protein product [Symbiodinium natans]|uniref:Uncharacterized protein n=1 Tax=Symbiodinium natans TaxID=878477 RepID=A0A812R8U3_9DINO|nr:unnamed protein product [Symbiodinium natans]